MSWAELRAYMSLTGIEIPPGECRIIISLAKEQDSMMHKASEPDCPAPYVSEYADEEQQSSNIISSFFARFKTK